MIIHASIMDLTSGKREIIWSYDPTLFLAEGGQREHRITHKGRNIVVGNGVLELEVER